MENKLTAVEWLIKELTPSIKLQQKYIDELETKAKEMEKEQIIDAFNMGMEEFANDTTIQVYQGEQYYNETFNK